MSQSHALITHLTWEPINELKHIFTVHTIKDKQLWQTFKLV